VRLTAHNLAQDASRRHRLTSGLVSRLRKTLAAGGEEEHEAPLPHAGGHLVVVVGGDSNYVLVADSSLWNRHAITRAQFLSWWEGFYAIVTPN